MVLALVGKRRVYRACKKGGGGTKYGVLHKKGSPTRSEEVRGNSSRLTSGGELKTAYGGVLKKKKQKPEGLWKPKRKMGVRLGGPPVKSLKAGKKS